MRILYNNLLESATISATNEDPNYPVENVHNTTLLSKFQADTNSAVITCTLDEASTVSTFAFGNHNIDTLSIKLTDSLMATTTHTYTAAELKFSDEVTRAIVYETAVTDVTEIEYTVTSVTTLYIGGMSAGQYLQMPYFAVNPKTGYTSSGKSQKSRGGVLFSAPGVVLETFSCTFDGSTITEKNAQVAWFTAVQTYAPAWYDRYEDSDMVPVMFAQNTKDVSHKKGKEGIIFDSFRLDLEECL